MSLTVEEVRDPRQLPRYRREWSDLVQHSPDGDLYHTYEWITTWLEAFWPNRPVAFFFVRKEDRLVGLAPLLLDENGEFWCRGSLVAPVNAYSTRTHLLWAGECDGIAAAILEHLRMTRRDVRVAFKSVRMDSCVVRKLPDALSRYGMSAVLWAALASPYVNLECGREQYYRTRSAHFRHELRRKRRKIEKAGTVRHVTVTSPRECERALADVFEIEKNSWKEARGSAFTSRESLRCFYGGLARRSAANGWLRLYLLHLDSIPVAHLYGVVFKNIYYAIKTSYDKEYHKHSPGSVLFGDALEDAFAQKFSRFDLLGVESRWKKDLATGSQPHVHMCLFSQSQYRCQMCRLVRGRVKPFLKRKAPFLVTVKQALDQVRRARVAKRP